MVGNVENPNLYGKFIKHGWNDVGLLYEDADDFSKNVTLLDNVMPNEQKAKIVNEYYRRKNGTNEPFSGWSDFIKSVKDEWMGNKGYLHY